VTSGYVHAGVPQAASSPHQVSVRISSGELELLPQPPGRATAAGAGGRWSPAGPAAAAR
jgi:hypothetical protein